jgi:hypothetical protein
VLFRSNSSLLIANLTIHKVSVSRTAKRVLAQDTTYQKLHDYILNKLPSQLKITSLFKYVLVDTTVRYSNYERTELALDHEKISMGIPVTELKSEKVPGYDFVLFLEINNVSNNSDEIEFDYNFAYWDCKSKKPACYGHVTCEGSIGELNARTIDDVFQISVSDFARQIADETPFERRPGDASDFR